MLKSLKEKLLSSITAHPRLVMFGIGLAVTLAIGTALGMVEHDVFAAQIIAQHNHAW
jgi:hypothetical protein